jgi:hypothetical protein
VGQDPGEQVHRLRLAEDIEPDRGREVMPAACAPAGDQEPARGRPGQQRRDIGRISDVVEDKQPSLMGGEPLHRPFRQRLSRQHVPERGLQRSGQVGQSCIDAGRGASGDPPGESVVGGVVGGPVRGQGALADPA